MNRRRILISRRTAQQTARTSQPNPNVASADTAGGLADETCARGLRRTFLVHVHSLDLFAVQDFYRNLVSSQRVLRHFDLGVARAGCSAQRPHAAGQRSQSWHNNAHCAPQAIADYTLPKEPMPSVLPMR